MTIFREWGVPLLAWAAVTLGARGWLGRYGLLLHRHDWALPFLAGFSALTLLIYIGGLIGIAIGAPLVIAAAGVVCLSGLAAGAAGRNRPASPAEREIWSPPELLLAAALGIYAGLAFLNACYFPITAMDAFAYDGRARFFMEDGTMNIALYHWPGNESTPRSNITYPPLFSLALSTVYMLGGWQSKMITGFFAVTWPFLVFAVLRRSLPRFAALLWTLGLAFTPEVFAHASFALLNLPTMALLLAEVACILVYRDTHDARILAVVALLGTAAAGVRPDAIVYHAVLVGACALFEWRSGRSGDAPAGSTDARFRTENHRRLARLGLAFAAPLLMLGSWAAYLRFVVGTVAGDPFSGGTPLGFGFVLSELPRRLFRIDTNGPVFHAWLVALAGLLVRRNRDALFLHTVTFGFLAALVVLFSRLDAGQGGGALEVAASSFKRSLFYVIPVAGLAAAHSAPFLNLARLGPGILYDAARARGPAVDVPPRLR